jgi:hypothetical protein
MDTRITLSPATRRALAGDLPSASLDGRREDVIDVPRAYTVRELQSAYAREATAHDADVAAERVARAYGIR